MNKTFKVELVGGPLCGLIYDWPENTPFVIFEKQFARYEIEDMNDTGKHTAFYKGWTENN